MGFPRQLLGWILAALVLAPGAELLGGELVQAPRPVMMAAWQRLKSIGIPGVATDLRFQITGQSRYVSPGGDDANPGTKQHPWKSLGKACAELKPNTVVYLLAGTYYGPVTVRVAGTQDSPAAIRALDGADVRLTYSDEWVKAEADQLVRLHLRAAQSQG